MRTSRIRTVTLAAVTAALALGLTACGGGDDGAKAAGGNPAGSAQSRNASADDGKSGAEANGGDSKNRAGSTNASDATDKGATAEDGQCVGDELLVTAEHRFADEQGDHLLLTASNEGDKPCWVTSFPSVRLGGDVDSAALPHSKKDEAGGNKHLTLQPGGKVYSAVNLFAYGSNDHTATSMALALRGTDGTEGPSYSVDAKGESPKFTWNEADVLNWNTAKPYDF